MSDPYADYKVLKFNRPETGILEVILSNPGKLNSLDEDGHRELSEVWRCETCGFVAISNPTMRRC